MKPEISVIIPVYNDAKGLRVTLNSLLKQDSVFCGYEVIVADNGSADNTADTAKAYIKKYPERVKLVKEDNVRCPAAARNKGIKASAGDVLCFIDADMWVEKDCIARINALFKNPAVVYSGCNVKVVANSGSIVERYSVFKGVPFQVYIEKLNFAGTGALVVRKEIFNRLGFFDSRLIAGEDTEFGNRVYDAGYKLNYAGDIFVYHPAYDTLRKIIKKYFRRGQGRYQLFKYYPERYNPSYRDTLNPQLYLPPNIFKVIKSFTSVTSGKEKIQFGLIKSICILSTRYGYLYEKFSSAWKRT